MDTVSLDQSDIERLSDRDKIELRQFIQNEQQRTQIQARSHDLTETCWKKCIAGSIRSKELEKGEQACLANCVDRFMDISVLAVKHLQSMRQG